MIGNMPPTNLIELLHDLTHPIPTIPFAYSRELLTHERRSHGGVMERRYDEDGDDLPSPEAKAASKLALTEKNRGWRRLCDVDRKSDFCSRVSSRGVKIGRE